MAVPYFRLDLDQSEIDAVVGVLKSGWLTIGGLSTAALGKFTLERGAGLDYCW